MLSEPADAQTVSHRAVVAAVGDTRNQSISFTVMEGGGGDAGGF